MTNTPFFKGFHHLFGRAKKSAAQGLCERLKQMRAMGPSQLCSFFGAVVEPEKIGSLPGGRNRVYSPGTTFWLMLGQAFRGSSLRDAVREAQAAFAELSGEVAGATGSYSDARKRLPQSELDAINERVCRALPEGGQLLDGRRVMVVDGTGVQLSDTAENQDWYPQPNTQQPGCGFPAAQLLVLMNLENGTIPHVAITPGTVDESGVLLTELLPQLRRGDVLVGDRGFCSYLEFALLAERGIDAVTRLHSARQWPASVKGDEACVPWKRPPLSACPEHVSEEQWAQLPETITVRYVRRRLVREGFRPQTVMVVTTIHETPAEEILEIYARRWEIELSIDDIKTTMRMDFIRAKTPAMVAKVITTHLIAYNLTRKLLHHAATLAGVAPRRLSFKGALDAIQRFAAAVKHRTARAVSRIKDRLLAVIAKDLLPFRPARVEPRVRKRRPKPFPVMTQPRHQMKAKIVDAQRA